MSKNIQLTLTKTVIIPREVHETANFDVVCHAVRTLVEELGGYDRLVIRAELDVIEEDASE